MRTRFQLGFAAALSFGLSGCFFTSPKSGKVPYVAEIDKIGIANSPLVEARRQGRIPVVAVEAVYADIAQQIGGDAVTVCAIQKGVDADPHAYEPTPSDAESVGLARIVIRNGAGYDAFVQKLIDASPTNFRDVVDVGSLAHVDSKANPHLWYDIGTDRALATTLATMFERAVPKKRAAIAGRAATFAKSLDVWDAQMRDLKAHAAGEKVATTEPVFDYVLERAGIETVTPRSFALAIEQGNDPAPQDIALLDALVPSGVKALVVNSQTVAPSTTRLADRARRSGLPIVSVSESLPSGTHVQTWLEGETRALALALALGGPH